MKHRAVYPGSFDPITNGHLDIIKRAGRIFDEIVVAVSDRSGKKFTFSLDERLQMIKKATSKMDFVKVVSFDCLLVNLAEKLDIYAVIRGLRAVSDFEYEFQMALMNRSLNPQVETFFLMPDEKFTYLSSSLVKEIASLNGDISEFVSDAIIAQIIDKIKRP